MKKTNRIDARFQALKAAGKKAFISFATAGYPDLKAYGDILVNLPRVGVDIIEIGMPFSDPMADGEAIQAANLQAFRAGITVPKILEMVKTFRKKDTETPIILMGYYNPIYSYGIMKFLDDAAKAGVDGFIIPDLPPEEDEEFRLPALERGLYQIRLVTPTTNEARLPTVLKGAKGFIYCVSVTGVTGGKVADADTLQKTIAQVRLKSTLPIAIGFGTSTPEQARATAKMGDAAIVGSSIMRIIAQYIDPKTGAVDPTYLKETLAFVKSIADAVHEG